MPSSPYADLILTPNADTAAVAAALGVTIDTPLYTLSDPTPRSQTHAWASTPWTSALDAAIETPVTGARATYPNTLFQKYHRVTERTLPAAKLVELGLTTNPDA